MCLAQGPQRSDAGEARTLFLESSTLPLSHCAPFITLGKRSNNPDLGPNCCKYQQTTRFAASRQSKLVNDAWL